MPSSLLIIQTGFLGDAVLASGMLRAVAASRPDLRVGMVVRQSFAELFRNHPAIHTLHPFDKKSSDGMERIVGSLRSAEYEAALLPHRSLRSALVAKRSGIGRRVGFRQSEAPWLLTDRVEYVIAQHETERNAMLLKRVGIIVDDSSTLPWLVTDRSTAERVRSRFETGRSIIVIAPGSVWPTKRWTIDGYAELAGRLVDAGRHVVLAGSPDERSICEEIERRVETSHLGNTAGILSLAELLALIAIAERVVTNDSAPLHLAESVGTPVTAIFGPTVPEFGFGPRRERSNVVGVEGLACRPCRIHGSERCPIGTHECMQMIGADEVMQSIQIEHGAV